MIIKRFLIFIAAIISILFGTIHYYFNYHPIYFEIENNYCITWKGDYLIPYKYNNLCVPKTDYIKIDRDKLFYIDIWFISPSDLLISSLKNGHIKEINMTNYNYITDSSNVIMDFDSIQPKVKFSFDYMTGLRHPFVWIREDSIYVRKFF